MGCHRERHQRIVTCLAVSVGCAKEKLRRGGGQSTAEYAVVLFGLLCVVVGLGALSNALSDGLFVKHALAAASHHLQLSALGSVADVFAY